MRVSKVKPQLPLYLGKTKPQLPVFAVDPGPAESAFVVWDGVKILDKGKIPTADILPLIDRYAGNTDMVCEMLACYGMAVGKEVFDTAVWIGRYVERAGGNMALVVRGKVKMHLCKVMKATDSNIRAAVIDIVGIPGTKKNPGPTFGVTKDIWAALALAVTYRDNLEDRVRL